jgi:hypothetical protein
MSQFIFLRGLQRLFASRKAQYKCVLRKLFHLVSSKGLEVDKTKVEVIEKLPSPINIKGVRSFLRHVGFYRRFIRNFSKIAKPQTNPLIKDAAFIFYDRIKKALTSAPVLQPPDWNFPFVFICNCATLFRALRTAAGR